MQYWFLLFIYFLVTTTIFLKYGFFKFKKTNKIKHKQIAIFLLLTFTVFVLHLSTYSLSSIEQDFTNIDMLIMLFFSIANFCCSLVIAKHQEV